MKLKQKLFLLVIDIFPWDRFSNDDDIIIKEIVNDIMSDINNRFGRIIINEKARLRIINRMIYFSLYQRKLLKKHGITIKNVSITEEKKIELKILLMRNILHQLILIYSDAPTFYEQFNNFIQSIGITNSEWLNKTHYQEYFSRFKEIVSKIYADKEKLKVIDYIKVKEISTTQGIARIQTKNIFFKDNLKIDESLIDQHIEIYKELVAIAESYIKFLFLFKYPSKEFEKVNKTKFYTIWDDLRNDCELKIFTIPFPNTVYFNASKHNAIVKHIDERTIKFV